MFHVLLEEFYTVGYLLESFSLLQLLSVVFAIFVIINNNPVYSVLCLIGLFFSISLYLIGIGLNFMGLSYLLVYVGAVSTLFLFTLMLINISISELLTAGRNGLVLAIMVTVLFSLTFISLLTNDSISVETTYNVILDIFNNIIYEGITPKFISLDADVYNNSVDNCLGSVSTTIWDSSLWESSHICSVGNLLYSSCFISLILIALILLLSMVGTIAITVSSNL